MRSSVATKSAQFANIRQLIYRLVRLRDTIGRPVRVCYRD
jgi:hypothetical protein